jgi:hypothetical protein
MVSTSIAPCAAWSRIGRPRSSAARALSRKSRSLQVSTRSGARRPLTKRFYVDQLALDAIGRMDGHSYSTTRDQFDLPTLSVDQWAATKRPLARAAG